jgi:cardiolipin synthase
MKSWTSIKPFFLFFLSVSILSITGGLAGATLPKVSEVIEEVPATQKPRQIVSANGLLSPEKSRAIMERLKGSGGPMDILQRHSAVLESVTESPLTKGNKVTLLVDGQVTYTAMFETIKNARDHINFETYIIEDDETGRKFADLLLQKQAEGVQVNLIYDSVGSFGTPASFFKRLRGAGIQVVEFNPVNPLKARGKWLLTHPDHRKLLIVDGRVVITGGINISQVYSSTPFRREKKEKA